jgi:hypothetical protein
MSAKYWKQMFGTRSNEFIEGVIEGMRAFAWWKDGVEYVGTTGTTLKEAIAEAKEGMGYKDER